MSKKIHLIAIGGAVMHNLALALQENGHQVSGSDDEIQDPSLSRLKANGLLPEAMGWFPERIHTGLDAVILGMHARIDNPELARAKELGLKVYSFPEYIYEHSKDKIRVVVGGSHGKTTITAMIMHVLQVCSKDFDYLVGSQLAGFNTMVKLSEKAPVIILEGDEYLTSPIDRRPKFHLYNPQIALLSGIAWDHINVFPTFDNYVEQFRIFVDMLPANGHLAYYEDDQILAETCKRVSVKCHTHSYNTPEYKIEKGISSVKIGDHWQQLEVFGKHNLANLQGAFEVCRQLGIEEKQFWEATASFKGAARRLELVKANDTAAIYRDFAHSPSKVKATIAAVKEQYPDRKLIACLELHTFSSLNDQFLSEYKDTMGPADAAIVYFNPHTIEMKRLKSITEQQVKAAFGGAVETYTDSEKLHTYLHGLQLKNETLLMMSSGTFDGMDLKVLAEEKIK